MKAYLTNERYEEIKRIVVNLFVQYDIHTLPINGFDIASKMNIQVIPYSSFNSSKQQMLLKLSKDGFCHFDRYKQKCIYYNDDTEQNNCERINTAILHEIGHITLDHTENSELAEKEVNFFAKYALVPPVLVQKLDIKTFTDIEMIFNVSMEASYYAYNYYIKWLQYSSPEYTDYELTLLELFKDINKKQL